MKEYARRKSSRLKNYNYSQNGAYFLTICTKDRKMLLGSVGAGVCPRKGSPCQGSWHGKAVTEG